LVVRKVETMVDWMVELMVVMRVADWVVWRVDY